jgi:hypothetical protein
VRRTIRAGLSLVGLLALGATTAAAQEAITNVKVLDAAGTPLTRIDATYSLPDGAKKATVQFDYNLGSAESVGLSIVALGAPPMGMARTLSGQGTASYEITGDALYHNVAEQALKGAASAVQAQANAGLQRASAMGFVDAIQASVSQLRPAVPLLKRLALDGDFAGSVANLEKALADYDAVVAAVTAAGTEEARKAKTADLKAPLGAAQTAAQAINDRLSKATGLALPTTGNDNHLAIDVSVNRNNTPALSLQIQVGTGSLVPTAVPPTPAPQSAAATATAAAGGSRAVEPTAGPAGATSAAGAGAGNNTGSSGANGSTNGSAAAGASPVAGLNMANAAAAGMASTALPGQPNAAAQPAAAATAAAVVALGGNPEQSMPDAPPGAAQAAATWTPGAGGQSASTKSGGGAGSSGPGPNVAIIAVGLFLLLGAGLWMRRRM